MTTDRINHANSTLMVLGAGAAFLAPFEVFLLAYAVLGPLHYLTEISWLSDRRCFLTSRREGLTLLMVCVAMVLVLLMPLRFDRKSEAIAVINYAAIAGTGVMVFARGAAHKVIASIAAAIMFLLGCRSEWWRVIFGPLLPTIIHVYFFTAAFIVLGALRRRSKSAGGSLAMLLLCSLSFFIVPMRPIHPVSEFARIAYAPFENINWIMMNALRLTPTGAGSALYDSPQGLAVMRFIAFAYLHHYLNWFSKVSIIKWNRISMRRAGTIAALWAASMWAYAHHGGALAILPAMLSYVHGFMEMPLDHRAFAGIVNEVRALLGERLDAVASRDAQTGAV
ncbi:MAG TPA: hypothetical protein VMT64_02145 [Candidatus Binataceae bacterium]|nr:hypothetical protein [Candidatus Binataceae bacterium]